MFDAPALAPKKEFALPEVLTAPALAPKNELLLPMFAAPAPKPAKTLEEKNEAVSTRPPPMLYCVVALTAFADRVPPAVPLPEILKLLPLQAFVF